MKDKQNKKAIEELSAYLDGESSNPAEVKRRLDADPDAARMASELSAISEALGRLPAPDVHPAFRTRVMATVRETPRVKGPGRLSWRWQAFAAMVVLAPFAAAIWTFGVSPPSMRPESPASPAPVAVNYRALVHYLFEQDEEVVLEELATVLGVGTFPAGIVPNRTKNEWPGGIIGDLSAYANDAEWQGVLTGLFGPRRVVWTQVSRGIRVDWPRERADVELLDVDDAEWLDVLAMMEPTVTGWDGALGQDHWDNVTDSLYVDEQRELKLLLMDLSTGDTTI